MSELIEEVAPTGSGDADFDAALAEVTPEAEPVAEIAPEPVVATPEPPQDFTFSTLENGERELRLATGQVYKGKDDAEVMNKVAMAQVEASRHITNLNARIKEAPAQPIVETPAVQQAVDPTALAIADLMAPAFGVKSGAELVAAFAAQQETAQRQQEFMAAQQANFEAANFFRAVPEFSKTDADAAKIDNFLQQNNIPFNAATAEMAYHTLKAKGEFASSVAPIRATAPKNNMPPPPTGTAPANTGKGATTEADLWSMTEDQLMGLMTQAGAQ